MTDVGRFFSKGELAARYGVHRRSIERWVMLRKYPPPDLTLPGGQVRWADHTVETHEISLVGKAPDTST